MAMQKYTYVAQNGKKRIHESHVNYNAREINNYIEYNEDISLPNELIKFYNVNQNNTNALLNNYLWAADPRSFNDPFDCSQQLWEIESFTKENLKRLWNDPYHRLITDDLNENFNLFFNLKIAILGIVCLHEFEESSQDILWGYYNNQEGFSVRFDTHQLINQWKNPFKIEYLDASELCHFNLDEVATFYDLFPEFLRWATQKKKSWIAENEWRFVFDLKADMPNLYVQPEERMKKYSLTAIKEVSLGLKFFDTNNSFQESINAMYFITDSINHLAQNQILTFLSEHQEISVSHMFFKDDLKLHPRKCQIFKQSNNRFLIQY
jgi:hypothetical protein